MTQERLPGMQRDTDPYILYVKMVNHVYELHPTIEVQVSVETTGAQFVRLAQWERGTDDLDNLGQVLSDLADAFVWGDGLNAVIATVQGEDRSAQSRRVRRAALEQ